MDGSLIEMIICVVVISAPFVMYMLVLKHLMWKRIIKHQEEWNEIKKSLQSEDKQAVCDAYYEYCDKLWAERPPTLGACFPRE